LYGPFGACEKQQLYVLVHKRYCVIRFAIEIIMDTRTEILGVGLVYTQNWRKWPFSGDCFSTTHSHKEIGVLVASKNHHKYAMPSFQSAVFLHVGDTWPKIALEICMALHIKSGNGLTQ
jgi:hypothetical protein